MNSRTTMMIRRLKRSEAVAVVAAAAFLLLPCDAFVHHLPRGEPSMSGGAVRSRRCIGMRPTPSIDHAIRIYQPLVLAQSTMSDPMSRREHDNDVAKSPATLLNGNKNEVVPSTMGGAVRRFFLGGDHGPLLVVASITYLIALRLQLAAGDISSSASVIPIGPVDGATVLLSVVFWWFQEHFIHGALLHSKFDWMGRRIHEEHHEKEYFSISIDPRALLIGWLAVAHGVTRLIFPLPLALSATIGYAMAGLWYEWAHFLAHTRVKPRSRFLKRMRDNHIRHHRINDKYWLGFSVPAIDDIFGTNPSVADARAECIERSGLAAKEERR